MGEMGALADWSSSFFKAFVECAVVRSIFEAPRVLTRTKHNRVNATSFRVGRIAQFVLSPSFPDVLCCTYTNLIAQFTEPQGRTLVANCEYVSFYGFALVFLFCDVGFLWTAR